MPGGWPSRPSKGRRCVRTPCAGCARRPRGGHRAGRTRRSGRRARAGRRVARRVVPGDEIILVGPAARSAERSVGLDSRPGGASRLLLVGDDTAAPAIVAILESLSNSRMSRCRPLSRCPLPATGCPPTWWTDLRCAPRADRLVDSRFRRLGMVAGRGGIVGSLDAGVMVAPTGPPVRSIQTVAVQQIVTSPSGRTLVDLVG